MAARLIQVLLALSFIIAGAAIGQTLFGTSPPPQSTTATSGPMSPNDFQKAVNSLGQQSQQQLMQQFKSQFNSGPGGNTMQIPQTSTIIPSAPASSTPTVTPTVAPAPKPVVIQPVVAPQAPVAPVAPPVVQQPAQTQIDNSAPLPGQGSSVYTGFAPPPSKDTNSNGNNSSNGNTPSSGGWNIHY